ncbi:Fc.00g040410.m01.CDS01 [Cosmosporella sp. VM-42]
MDTKNIVTTSYLLGNLHCPSCVALIKSLLRETYGHHVLWVSPNLVTSVVTVEHQDNSVASVRSIKKTLEDVGFEVCGFNTTASATDDLDRGSQLDLGESSRGMGQFNGTFDSWFRQWWPKQSPSVEESARATHLENCEACRSAVAIDPTNPQDDQTKLAKVSTETLTLSVKQSLPEPLQRVVTGDDSSPSRWRATLSIGGMTCGVCVNTITDEISKNPWISKVVVNLVANSATVDFTDRNHTQDIVDGIEDLGYDATIDKVIDLSEDKQSTDEREVEIKVDGIFCPRCPERITRTLKSLNPSKLTILQETTLANPILKLRYTPEAPVFTIRHILRAIEAADTSLNASVYHPPTLEERSRVIRAKHQRALLWREILTLIIAIPTFILGIVYMSLVPKSSHSSMYLMEPWVSGLSRLDVALCILATPVYFFAADIFHVRAAKEVRTMWRSGSRMPFVERFYKFGSMNMLISLGTSIAYLSSVAQMIATAATNKNDNSSKPEYYFDSVVFLTLFLLAGRLIEAYSKSKTGDAVEMLGKLRPTTALLLEKDKAGVRTTTNIDVDQLEFGDLIRIPHGASPAADGMIVAGESIFDESSLTGESRPIKKAKGDQVFAGTINKASAITVRVTGAPGRSMLDQIVEVVREGQTKRAPIEQIADIMTTYFVPVITLIAIITWIVWMSLGFTHTIPGRSRDSDGDRVAFAFQFAIAVFVVACPCGLALAAPTAIFVGGGIAAKHGILAKGGGEAFEKASKIDCVVFDKTGTLTVGGEPQITDSAMFLDSEDGRRGVLEALKAIEESSSHPIAKAIVAFCGAETQAAEIDGLEEVPGRGMKATYTGPGEKRHEIIVGNELLMRDVGVSLSTDVSSLLNTWKTEAKSIALVATKPTDNDSWTLAAALSISDPIRPEAIAVVKALVARGTQVWMLSGDNEITARAVARRIGIPSDNVLAEVLPSQKAAKISYLQSTLHAGQSATRRAMIAMVGDGINDSPALTTADVGIAIGSGSDVAISSADFVLATSSLTAVLTLLDLSRVVFRRIKVNFGWAVVYNLVAVPIAAGCFWPLTTSSGSHVKLDPVWASLAMALSSISVVLSSLSLRARVPGVGFRHTRVEP